MSPKEDIEMTIRTATLIKALSSLVGVGNAKVAKLMFAESVNQFAALGKFIDTCQPSGKPEQR